eukprot:TRINITY_DN92253_c0_g1_i1.p1 TRINITY_DN92253_c0_g1~~TRINITY_DN92253_c0_g1_i1.p1  ORF type:complete len:181 (-),score=27.99 TRINITY_DN92253_c0_g1_i1:13-555(-)
MSRRAKALRAEVSRCAEAHDANFSAEGIAQFTFGHGRMSDMVDASRDKLIENVLDFSADWTDSLPELRMPSRESLTFRRRRIPSSSKSSLDSMAIDSATEPDAPCSFLEEGFRFAKRVRAPVRCGYRVLMRDGCNAMSSAVERSELEEPVLGRLPAENTLNTTPAGCTGSRDIPCSCTAM